MGASSTEFDAEYGADQIQILEGLEAVRKRPGMYIGSTSTRGLHHLVYEIVDNSVDEALAGYCDEIQVNINKDNSVTVCDNGRGIPVGINHKAGLPAVEVVFTVLHAGGKFGGGGYKVSGGLHGVGASVVNALSEWLEVEIYHDGQIYKQRYERGKVVYKLKVVGECEPDRTGTTVTFFPDAEIFDDTVFDYDKRDMEEGHVGYYDFSQMMEMRLDADAYVAWKNVFDASIVYWNTTDKNYSMFKRMFSMEGTNGITHYIPLSVDSKAAEAYRSMAWYKAAGLENMGW